MSIDFDRLQAAMRGEVIQPDNPEYDAARRVYNGMIDKRPAAVARCVDVADVMSAVDFARDNDLLIAVRGGGHSAAGKGTCDDGLVIDLSRMNSIHVDPARRTARVEGGATWGDFDHAAHAFGLATPGGIISTTGVAGLTLGGGFGYLTRKYGLSCDNLLSVDVVTADGTMRTASAEENTDLFWAVRGGGGNFGVVTSLEFRLHPVDTVYAGPILYPLEHADELLRFFRDFTLTAPDDVSAFFAFLIVPPAPFFPEELHGKTVCALVVCHLGPLEAAERDLRPVRETVAPVLDLCGPMPYPALNAMFDALLPHGLHHYWKSDFSTDLSNEAIDAHLAWGPKIGTVQSALHIYPLAGAQQQVGPHDTAFSYRDANFAHIIAAIVPEGDGMAEHTAWVRGYWDALHPHSAGGAYVNFLMDEGDERIAASYRDNYARLASIKNVYDPENLFQLNQNVRPARVS